VFKKNSQNQRTILQTIYLEKDIEKHSRAQDIIKSMGKNLSLIHCNHYGEVFNPKSQNFRLQKQNPALILAKKTGRLVLPVPTGFGIGGAHNYYFSHMLNCLYDCRYCFLQGMYPSANYVLFINYEDFQSSIDATLAQHQHDEKIYFFSGYDCDSLAYEPISHFVQEFLPFFAKRANAILELRTKSSNIRQLLQLNPIENCVVAYSLTPDAIAKAVEHKAPSIAKRVQAIQKLAAAGWKIGLRFDPLIDDENFEKYYQELLDNVFSILSPSAIHSVSLGPLRFPEKMYKRIVKLYPNEPLFAQSLSTRDKHISYSADRELQMKNFLLDKIKNYVDTTLLFQCNPL
jgi:spore photoproduct lyase